MADAAFNDDTDIKTEPMMPPTPDELHELHDVRPMPRISVQAFCETRAVAAPIERMAEDRRMAKTQTRVYMGGLAAAVEFYQSAPTPNLIILETTSSADQLMAALAELAGVCDPSSKVVIIGHQNDVTLYRDLVKAGISEYMVAPISIADLMGVATTLFVDPNAAPLGRSIAFVGAKGGVGSSTIAHNVGWSIANLFKNEVVVADLDLAFGTANINFDQDPAQSIADALFNPERVDEAYLDRLLATCSENLSLLAAPSMLDKVYDFDADGFAGIVDAAQRTAPTVVLDVPHAWNGWTRKTLQGADEIVIVASPELANLRNAKNLIDAIQQLRPNDFKPKLVMNQVDMPKRPEISVDDFCGPLGIAPSAVIPFDPALFGTAANNGRMLAESEPGNPVAGMMSDLAHIVTGRGVVVEKPKPGLMAMLSKLKKK